MSDHPEDGPPNESSSNAFEKKRRGNDGMQRRDLLLGGSSLAAMTRNLEARKANDPMVIADTHSAWHRMYHEHPRAIVALHSPADAVPLGQRFDEIWELSEPWALGRLLGF